MHTPAKGASLGIGFEGSNPSLHAICFHSIVDSTAVYGTAELSSSLSGNTTVGLLTIYPMNKLVRLLREPKATIGSSPALNLCVRARAVEGVWLQPR